jgi:hypothetical protein
MNNVNNNIKENTLSPLAIHSNYLEEVLSAVLHTILFVRVVDIAQPEDHICDKLKPLIFVKCGLLNVDKLVRFVHYKFFFSFYCSIVH